MDHQASIIAIINHCKPACIMIMIMIPIETGGLLLWSRNRASLSSQLCSLPLQHTLLWNRCEFFVIALMKRLIISLFFVDNRLSFGKIYQLLRYPLPSKLLQSHYITFNFTDIMIDHFFKVVFHRSAAGRRAMTSCNSSWTRIWKARFSFHPWSGLLMILAPVS